MFCKERKSLTLENISRHYTGSNISLGMLFIGYFIHFIHIYSLTFQMLSLFPVFPSATPLYHSPPPACMRVLPHPPTHSCLHTLKFPYTGALSLHRTKGLSSHWCPTRPSCVAYTSGAMDHSMCTLWMVVLSLEALGVWLDDIVFLMGLQTISSTSVLC